MPNITLTLASMEEERYLDYDNWYVCYSCGREQVPYEDENFDSLVDLRMCQDCIDFIDLDHDDDDAMLIYGE